MGTDILDRPPEAPAQAQPGPSLRDGNPLSNTRGQYGTQARAPVRPPVPTREQLRIELEQYEAEMQAAEAEAAAAETTAAAAGTAEADAAPGEIGVPVWGWIVGGVAVVAVGGVALYAWHKHNEAVAARKKVEDAKRKLDEQEQQPQSGGGGNDGGNVKITGHDPCDLQPYDKAKCPDKYEAHHVIADLVLRYGKRGTDTRIPNAPSLEKGLTICLSQSEHDQVHAIMDKAIKALGQNSTTGQGTAPIGQIVDKAIEAVEKVKPECKGKFEDVRKQFEHMDDQPGRTTHNPPKDGSPAQQTLKSGGAGTGTR